jgi:hypothetical protein
MTIYRISPKGLEFNITELPEGKLEIRLAGTSKLIIVEMKLETFSAAFYQWQMKGLFIQDAFKTLNNEEREFLITGITPTEWKELFPPEEDDVTDEQKESYAQYVKDFPKSDPRD